MAWTTCKYCGKKTNGYDATFNHVQNAHPLEGERDVVQYEVDRLRDNVAFYGDKLEDYRACEETLANYPDLPHQAIKLLRRQVGDGSSRERLEANLQSFRDRLQEAQIRLQEAEAALQRGKES